MSANNNDQESHVPLEVSLRVQVQDDPRRSVFGKQGRTDFALASTPLVAPASSSTSETLC